MFTYRKAKMQYRPKKKQPETKTHPIEVSAPCEQKPTIKTPWSLPPLTPIELTDATTPIPPSIKKQSGVRFHRCPYRGFPNPKVDAEYFMYKKHFEKTYQDLLLFYNIDEKSLVPEQSSVIKQKI